MEGVIIVEKKSQIILMMQQIKKLEFPFLQYTPDRNIEVNLSWHPSIIKTHEKIQFVYEFYDPQTNSNLAKMKYDFIMFQNGKEIFCDKGLSQIDGGYRNYVFTESGSIIIRIEGISSFSILAEEGVTVSGNIENNAPRSADFITVVMPIQKKLLMKSIIQNQLKDLKFIMN